MLLRGGYFRGTSRLICEIPTGQLPYSFYQIQGAGLARSRSGLEYCGFEYSVGGAAWQPVFELFDGDEEAGSAYFTGISASTVAQTGPNATLHLSVTLQHSDYWDFCYANDVQVLGYYSYTTTSTALTTQQPNPPVPDQLFLVNYEVTSNISDWTAVSSSAHASVGYNSSRGALSAANGTAVLETSIVLSLEFYDRVDVFAVIATQQLATLDCCIWSVVFQPSGVQETVLILLQEHGPEDQEAFATFDPSYPYWNTSDSILLRYSSFATGANSACFIRAAGVSGDVS